MATETTNYGLTKPASNDYYSVDIQNSNMDLIDAQLKENEDAAAAKQDAMTAGVDYLAPTGNGSNLTEAFTEAGTRANIATGESHATIFGKIKKWFTDLKTVAFSGSYNDLTNRPVIPDALSDLTGDSTHRTVTDAEKTTWNGKQDALSGDVAGHYHTADRNRANHTGTQVASTISDFAAAVRSTVLTGLSTATNAVISATDTILSALGKLQAQITANLATLTSHTGNGSNPHGVTASQVGLGNVTNESKATMLTSPALTGTPTSPTAAADTNTTQVATTAFVVGQAGSSTPAMNGTAAVGTSKRYARQDHAHPTDTSRAAASHAHTPADITISADTSYGTAKVRGIYATTTDLTAGSTALTSGTIALVYE